MKYESFFHAIIIYGNTITYMNDSYFDIEALHGL